MSGTLTAVLFDVDGTLVDSNYLHAVSWWEAFIQAGHDVPMARIHRTIGMGSDQLLDALLRAALAADDAIDEATSSADVERSKPAPDLVQVALDKARVRPDAAVFVGDTIWDVQACGKAGVPCVGLLSGGISRAELLDAGAAEVYEGPAELLDALPRSMLGRG